MSRLLNPVYFGQKYPEKFPAVKAALGLSSPLPDLQSRPRDAVAIERA